VGRQRMDMVRARLAASGPFVVVGLVVAAAHLIGIRRPAPWLDEAATVLSAWRTLPGLLALLAHHDAVHGVYYLLAWVWGHVFGGSVVSLRVMSALVVGVGAGLIAWLGDLLGSRRAGLLAAVAWALLPRTLWTSVEARSYALSATLVTACMILFVLATRDVGGEGRTGRRGAWVRYATGLVVTVWVMLFNAFAFAALPVVIALTRRGRAVWRSWLVATGAAALVCLPIALVVRRQQSFLTGSAPPVDWGVMLARAVTDVAYLPLHDPIGRRLSPVWLAVEVVVLVVAVVACRRGGDATFRSVFLLAWLIVPVVVLVGWSLYARMDLTPRYAVGTTPALALLIGFAADGALTRLRGWWPRAVLVILAVAVAIPGWIAQRAPDLNGDYGRMAEVVARHKQPGDVLIAGPMGRSSVIRLMPEPFEGVPTINIRKAYWQRADLYDTFDSVADHPELLDDHQRIWFWAAGDRVKEQSEDFTRHGYVPVISEKGAPISVVLFEKQG